MTTQNLSATRGAAGRHENVFQLAPKRCRPASSTPSFFVVECAVPFGESAGAAAAAAGAGDGAAAASAAGAVVPAAKGRTPFGLRRCRFASGIGNIEKARLSGF